MQKEILSQAKNTSSVTTKGMLLSKGLDSIINYVKENFNPDTKLYQEANKLYQEMEWLKYCWLDKPRMPNIVEEFRYKVCYKIKYKSKVEKER